MIKRLYPIVFTFLLAAPLVLAQDSGSTNSQPANAGGAWQISWQARSNPQPATMQIQQDGSKLSGTFQDSGGSSPVTGSIARNKVSFSLQIQGRSMTLAFTGTIDGDKMSGIFRLRAEVADVEDGEVDRKLINGAAFGHRATLVRVGLNKIRMKTTNTDFELQPSLSRHSYQSAQS